MTGRVPFWDGPGRNLSIHAGTLVSGTGLTLYGYIFCAHKADYCPISDGLPQVAADDPGLTTQVGG